MLVLIGVLLSGCDLGSDPASTRPALTRGQFIEVMVALRDAKIDLELADNVPEGRFQEVRDSILAAHRVQEAELFAFVNAHPAIEYQAELWDSINRRLKRPLQLPAVEGRRSTLPDSVGELQQPPKPDAIERQGPTRR